MTPLSLVVKDNPEYNSKALFSLFSNCISWPHPLSQMPWPSRWYSAALGRLSLLVLACTSSPRDLKDHCHLLTQTFSDLTVEKNTLVPPLYFAYPISLLAVFPLELILSIYFIFLFIVCLH